MSSAAEARPIEGITYFDHANNPGHPARWHVRDDGWMGASFNRTSSFVIRRDKPLILRYLLHAHHGIVDPNRADEIAASFDTRPVFQVKPLTGGHVQFKSYVNRFDVPRLEHRE